jgi:hypothetical protein
VAEEYNPLNKENLGISVREALLKQPVNAMVDLLLKDKFRYSNKFEGAGIYALYYFGDFQAYKSIAIQNKGGRFEAPIYVGKAVPKGSRKGGLMGLDNRTNALFERLKLHAQGIAEVSNLELSDFRFRSLVVDDIWIPLGETYLIERFQPLWNKVVEGFGIKTPGRRRREQYKSLWDTIHPGRKFVAALGLPPNPRGAEQILREIEAYLSMPQEEKAMLPLKDDGSSGEEDEVS